jgi:hypothetical protein
VLEIADGGAHADELRRVGRQHSQLGQQRLQDDTAVTVTHKVELVAHHKTDLDKR